MANRRNNARHETLQGALPVALAFALMQAAGTSVGFAQQSEPGDMPAQEQAWTGDEQFAPDQSAEFAPEQSADEDFMFGDESIAVSDEFFVELHVKDDDLATVLEMLSIQSQRNIIMSANVSATVTANLYGVTFYEALDSILHVNGFGYLEKGNFIYVYTINELQEIQAAARQRVSKVINLNYLTSVDAAEFVSPLLSDGGQIITNGRTESFVLPSDLPTGADDYALGAMLVVYDFEENVEEIIELIAEIDTRPAQVLVEATVLQASLNEANAFGIDFSIVSDINITDFINNGGPLGSATSLLSGVGSTLAGGGQTPVAIPGTGGDGAAIASNYGNVGGPATLKAGVVNGDFAIFLRLLDEVTDTTILANPKILALNRQPARVLVGKRVGYLSTTSTQTTTTQTVQFLDTGTQLYFRPFVTNDGMIRMELKPQVSDAIIRTVTDVQGAAVTIPDELTNEITTNVLVRDGQTIVLGGLFREAISSTRRQVPFLGDIPIVGAAFRGQDDEVKRDEIIFMITPSVVTNDILTGMGQRALEYTENVRAGSRRGLLPFSRERQSSQLLVEARNLAREGKTDRALHCIQRAIELKPTASEAYQLRAKLLNKYEIWPSNSMLEDIIHNETAELLGLKTEDFDSFFEIQDAITAADEAEDDEASASGSWIYGENWEPQDDADGRDGWDDGFTEFESDESSDEFESNEGASDEFAGAEEQKFSCDFDNESVNNVFDRFAEFSGMQFVASSGVTGTVTAKMSNVEWQDAFDAVMRVNGWTYDQHGQFLYVYTQDEWRSMQAAVADRESFDDTFGSDEADEFTGDTGDERSFNESNDEWTQSDESDSSIDAGAFAAGVAAGAAANEAASSDPFATDAAAGDSDAFSSDKFGAEGDEFDSDATGEFNTNGESGARNDAKGTPSNTESVTAEEASSEEREARAQALAAIFRESWSGFRSFAASANSWYGRMTNVFESETDSGR